MSLFVAVAAPDGAGATLPDLCAAAMRLPGALAATQYTGGGFACAASRTRDGAEALRVDRGVAVAGDVRLDGRDELIRALRGTDGGSSAPTRGGTPDADDMALVIAAYLAWGAGFVERLRGDFSFVLWDGAHRAFFAARDGLGVRPLYYARVPGGLCLSNTLDAVRAHPSVSGALHAPAIVSFLECGWNRDTTTTTFAAISRLAPGTAIRRTAGQSDATVGAHWRMPDPAPLRYRRDEEYLEHYRALLGEAVRDRITGATTILLSGGLDSTSIAATAGRVAERATLSAVTMRTPEVESPDEVRLATTVAARLGIAHEVRESMIAPMSGRAHQTPEPYDDPDLPALSATYGAIGKRSPVVLEGEDGDALFSPPGLGTMFRLQPAGRVLRNVLTYTVRHGHHPYLGWWLARRLRFWRRRESAERPPWLLATAGPSAVEAARPANLARPNAARWLTGSIWQSVHQGADRAYLRAPVEFRWPLLDTRIIEFVFAIPPIPWCQRKQLVRRAFAGELPREVVERPKTTVPGYYEYAVAAWRRRTGAALPPLHERTADFVDAPRLGEALRAGATEAVVAAWRALLLDRWFRGLEAA